MSIRGNRNKAVVGVFSYVDDAAHAIREAQSRDWEYRVYAPCPVHELEELTFGAQRSPVRMFTLTGGILGLIGGFGLAILTNLDWPLRTSAKPIVSIPAFVPVGYECTILLAALCTFGAMALFCRLPYLFRKMGYDPRFSDDKFGVVIACASGDEAEVEGVLKGSGADEVSVKDAL